MTECYACTHYCFLGFSDGSVDKESAWSVGDTGDAGLIPGLERSPGVGDGNPLQYSCLENSMDRGALWATVHGDFPGGSVVKNPPVNAGDTRDEDSVPELGRFLGVGDGNPLQYSCLENFMDRGAWQATVHGVAKSQT